MTPTLRLGGLCYALLLSTAGCYAGTSAYARPHAAIRSDGARLLDCLLYTSDAADE